MITDDMTTTYVLGYYPDACSDANLAVGTLSYDDGSGKWMLDVSVTSDDFEQYDPELDSEFAMKYLVGIAEELDQIQSDPANIPFVIEGYIRFFVNQFRFLLIG